jgi:tetratricopeptide (TPR) repeat protein
VSKFISKLFGKKGNKKDNTGDEQLNKDILKKDTSDFSLSVSFGEDNEYIICPKGCVAECEITSEDTGLYRCPVCNYEFIPEIYKPLAAYEDCMKRGWENYQLEQFMQSIKDYSAAIKLSPDNKKAFLGRGKSYFELDNWDDAERDFSEALRLDPDYDVAYFMRGETRRNYQNFSGAIEDYTKSIEFAPNFADSFRFRGAAYFESHEYKKAILDLTEYIRLVPDNALCFYERGYSDFTVGDYRKAIDDFSKALEIKPDFVEAFYRRAESYEKLGEDTKALQDYFRMIKHLDDPNNLNPEIEGNFTRLKNKFNSSELRHIQDEIDPPNQKTVDKEWQAEFTITTKPITKFDVLAEAQEASKNGDYKEAIDQFSIFIELDPTNPIGFLGRAISYYQVDQFDEGIDDAENYLQLTLGVATEEKIKNGLVTLCFGLGKKEDFELAVKTLSKFIEDNPQMPDLYFYRSQFYKYIPNLDLALLDLNRAIEIDPIPSYYKLRAEVNQAMSNNETAIADLKTYLSISGDNCKNKEAVEDKISELERLI